MSIVGRSLEGGSSARTGPRERELTNAVTESESKRGKAGSKPGDVKAPRLTFFLQPHFPRPSPISLDLRLRILEYMIAVLGLQFQPMSHPLLLEGPE